MLGWLIALAQRKFFHIVWHKIAICWTCRLRAMREKEIERVKETEQRFHYSSSSHSIFFQFSLQRFCSLFFSLLYIIYTRIKLVIRTLDFLLVLQKMNLQWTFHIVKPKKKQSKKNRKAKKNQQFITRCHLQWFWNWKLMKNGHLFYFNKFFSLFSSFIFLKFSVFLLFTQFDDSILLLFSANSLFALKSVKKSFECIFLVI